MILEEYSLGDPMNTEDFIFGEPFYLDVVSVNPNPLIGPRGPEGPPGDPGSITPEFIETIAIEVSEELEPPIDLLVLFENALF